MCEMIFETMHKTNIASTKVTAMDNLIKKKTQAITITVSHNKFQIMTYALLLKTSAKMYSVRVALVVTKNKLKVCHFVLLL